MISLREYSDSDFQPHLTLANNAAVSEYLPPHFPYPYTEEDAKLWMNNGRHQGIQRVIDVDGEFIGSIGAVQGTGEKAHVATIGYWLGQPYWGKGYASSAVTLFTDWLFEGAQFERLEALVLEGNTGSMKVLEKADFQFEGKQIKAFKKDGVFYNDYLFAKIKSP